MSIIDEHLRNRVSLNNGDHCALDAVPDADVAKVELEDHVVTNINCSIPRSSQISHSETVSTALRLIDPVLVCSSLKEDLVMHREEPSASHGPRWVIILSSP
jgi:hypothetical protein